MLVVLTIGKDYCIKKDSINNFSRLGRLRLELGHDNYIEPCPYHKSKFKHLNVSFNNLHLRYGLCEDFINYKPWQEGVKKLGR